MKGNYPNDRKDYIYNSNNSIVSEGSNTSSIVNQSMITPGSNKKLYLLIYYF